MQIALGSGVAWSQGLRGPGSGARLRPGPRAVSAGGGHPAALRGAAGTVRVLYGRAGSCRRRVSSGSNSSPWPSSLHDPARLLDAHYALGRRCVLPGRVVRGPRPPGAGALPLYTPAAPLPDLPLWAGLRSDRAMAMRPGSCGCWAIRTRP